MKYILLTLTLLFATFTLSAQTILGEWETYDDNTNEKKSIVEIFENNNIYYAKIKETFMVAPDATCEECKGEKKGQPIIGLQVIEGLKKKGDSYEGGTALDPESGKIYKCYLQLESPDKLKVRGYIGFSLLGRTQYWKRKVG